MGKHIAMLCMSLNIGGAETHIYELSKQLCKEGHNVTVFSNGGVYAQPLVDAGVRHVQAPLNRKSLSALWKSYRILLKEFQVNRPSVVHSHTRISNMVGGLVCKKLNIPMVTTVHFNFKSSFIYRLFSNWGCRALAVSEDLKTYLVDNYKYDPQKISLTVNGIDMKRFQKRDEAEFKKSLGLKPEDQVILLVSRLDRESSVHVSCFLDVAPQVYQRCPNTRVVIVGSGKIFGDFQARVGQINKECGNEFISLEGARTNIEQYTAIADLFVGISRSALEAMSASVPTILLGNLGYLGLYSDKIITQCIETNLTCRGYPYPSNEELVELITDCLSKRDLSKNIADGLRLVRDRFSIQTMSETAMVAYNDAIEQYRPLDYMVSGYYGRNNFGDNLTLGCLMEHLKDYQGTVLSNDPANTNIPQGVGLIHRFNLFQIRKVMKQTKVFLFGSGSILQDATSNRSIFYYCFIMRMAMRYGCKTMLYSNGVGPITGQKNIERVKKILSKVDLITIRDRESLAFLEELVPSANTVLTQDDAFSFKIDSVSPILPPKAGEGKTIVGINFKFDNERDPKISLIAEALKELSEKFNLFYYLIPYHQMQDSAPLKALFDQLGNIAILANPSADSKSLIRYAAGCDLQIVERLHGQVASAMFMQPYLPINYDPKNHGFSAQTGMTSYLLDHDAITKEALIRQFSRIMEDRKIIQNKLKEFNAEARLTAKENRKYLYDLIKNY